MHINLLKWRKNNKHTRWNENKEIAHSEVALAGYLFLYLSLLNLCHYEVYLPSSAKRESAAGVVGRTWTTTAKFPKFSFRDNFNRDSRSKWLKSTLLDVVLGVDFMDTLIWSLSIKAAKYEIQLENPQLVARHEQHICCLTRCEKRAKKPKFVAQRRPTLYFSKQLSSTRNKYFCCASIQNIDPKLAMKQCSATSWGL